MAVQEELALSRLLGALYTEVFQRKPANPNKPLNRGSHQAYEQSIEDSMKTRLLTDASITEVWGPSGSSDETDSSNLSVRWSFTGQWA
jgi:hypothetical protein